MYTLRALGIFDISLALENNWYIHILNRVKPTFIHVSSCFHVCFMFFFNNMYFVSYCMSIIIYFLQSDFPLCTPHVWHLGDYFFRGVAKLRGLAKAKDLHQLHLGWATKKTAMWHTSGIFWDDVSWYDDDVWLRDCMMYLLWFIPFWEKRHMLITEN